MQVLMMCCLSLDMQRFQAPYNLKAIPEVQEYLNVAFEKSKHHGDLQDLYRRRYAVMELLTPFSTLLIFSIFQKSPGRTKTTCRPTPNQRHASTV